MGIQEEAQYDSGLPVVEFAPELLVLPQDGKQCSFLKKLAAIQ